ncbi:MAG: 4Fe-4S binding protein [Candidatus Tectomicrobia bacterium]|uniref:4Fe-4S binding protein n=1 Tax=Tectimicrobiota bacterium TaxID=2528274 RepID=A0A933GLJ3_UNCTE|nr:4Fe-4S binding protein [Candidatus Tectomicrobia bacterium]
MEAEEVYKRLADELDKFDIGVPREEELFEILRMRYTPEEAEFAVHLTYVPETAQVIGERAGMEPEEVERMLERMREKGLVFFIDTKKGRKWSHIVFFGVNIQMPFHKMGDPAKEHPELQKLARLWERYYDKSLGNRMHEPRTSFLKVLPVERAIPTNVQVLPYQKVSEIIGNTNFIALLPCACRIALKKCDKPTDNCFAFDSLGKFFVGSGAGREIGKEEALRVLDQTEEDGLVHTTNNVKEAITFICNCCECCCHLMRRFPQLQRARVMASSGFVAENDAADCTGCAVCTGVCQVKAISLVDNVACIDEERCIGCGLCVRHCPTDCLKLRPLAGVDIPSTFDDLWNTRARERQEGPSK